MLSEAAQALIRGDRFAWALVAALWIATAVAVFAHRRDAHPSLRRVIGLLFAALATSAAGLVVASAVAVPRLRWRSEESADLVVPEGETWRRLRGPSVQVATPEGPDIAVPTIDVEGRWVLYGLLSGLPVEGLLPAPDMAPRAGAPRLCHTATEMCRAWPAAWPDPTQAGRFGELVWEKAGALDAAAYDVETRVFLTGGALEPQGPRLGPEEVARGTVLELIGRLSNDPAREHASSLFVVRRISGGRLRATRVVSTPSAGKPFAFVLQRADVGLLAGPLVYRLAARPVLLASALGLPFALIAYLFAPAWLAAILRRRAAVKRVLRAPLVLAPIAQSSAPSGPMALAAVTEDADLGDALLERGDVVALGLDVGRGEPVVSRAWFELPGATPWDDEEDGRASVDGSPRPAYELGVVRRRLGVLIPADREPFRRAAEAWLSRVLHEVAAFVVGLAALAPGLVALASLIAGR
ncbi:MAG TPA: hypothetical protein VE093_09730 [Polyangiaceae bacterium]|jgi:hypothetical protein|nr:hypothetical protein [Polyangiaceae bacterium]